MRYDIALHHHRRRRSYNLYRIQTPQSNSTFFIPPIIPPPPPPVFAVDPVSLYIQLTNDASPTFAVRNIVI